MGKPSSVDRSMTLKAKRKKAQHSHVSEESVDKSRDGEASASVASAPIQTSLSKSLSNVSQLAERTATDGHGTIKAEEHGPNKFRKLFFNMKDRLSTAEKTEYPKAIRSAFEDIDSYKLCVDNLSDAIICAIQQNPYFRDLSDPIMPVLPPGGCEPHELVVASLKDERAFGTYTNREFAIEIFNKLAELNREYLGKMRKAMHGLRTFINHDYWVIGMSRKELEKTRYDMDFAKHDFKTSKDPAIAQVKSKVYDDACQAYELQLSKVAAALEALPKFKSSHTNEVRHIMDIQRRHHNKVFEAIKKMKAQREAESKELTDSQELQPEQPKTPEKAGKKESK